MPTRHPALRPRKVLEWQPDPTSAQSPAEQFEDIFALDFTTAEGEALVEKGAETPVTPETRVESAAACSAAVCKHGHRPSLFPRNLAHAVFFHNFGQQSQRGMFHRRSCLMQL